jgi:sec-independent protein translocase protein TatB
MFFDIGWTEFALIGGVALIAIGPKELPGALRTAGQWVGKARRLAQDFQSQFQEVLREADIADMKKQFDDAANAASAAPTNLLGTTVTDVKDALALDVPDGSSPVKPADPAPETHVEALQHTAAVAGDVAAEPAAPAALPAASDKAP